MNTELPYFGHIDLNQLTEYYSTKIERSGNLIRFDLNFANKSINQEQLKSISAFLGNIAKYEIRNKEYINKNFNEKGESADYINFILEEFDQKDLSTIIEYDEEESSNERQLLGKQNCLKLEFIPTENITWTIMAFLTIL